MRAFKQPPSVKFNRYTICFSVLVLALVASVALRIYLMSSWQDNDFKFFSHYIYKMRNDAFGDIMSTHFTKLSTAYLYLLYPLTVLETPLLYPFKCMIALFDYLSAFWCFLIIRLRFTRPSLMPLLAATLVAFAPVSPMVSSVWGQLDGVYTSFLFGSVYFLMHCHSPQAGKHDGLWAMLMFSLAFCFKLQSILIIPALCFFIACGTLRVRYAIIPVAVYVLIQLPRFLVGYPVGNLFTGYVEQVNTFYGIAVDAPNMYLLLQKYTTQEWRMAADNFGTYTGHILCLLALWAGSRVKYMKLSSAFVLLTCTLSLLLATYVITRMHARYFYPADLISIAMAFYFPRLWYVPLIANLAGALSYLPRFMMHEYMFIPLHWLAILVLIAIVVIARQWIILYKRLYASDKSDALR
jgi:Gpi18-like mannosyltransferase